MLEKKLVVINQGKKGSEKDFPEIFKANGWQLETIELTAGESLSKNLELTNGLTILSRTANVFAQSPWPIKVYMDA